MVANAKPEDFPGNLVPLQVGSKVSYAANAHRLICRGGRWSVLCSPVAQAATALCATWL